MLKNFARLDEKVLQNLFVFTETHAMLLTPGALIKIGALLKPFKIAVKIFKNRY
jgi:hypothetical protein